MLQREAGATESVGVMPACQSVALLCGYGMIVTVLVGFWLKWKTGALCSAILWILRVCSVALASDAIASAVTLVSEHYDQ